MKRKGLKRSLLSAVVAGSMSSVFALETNEEITMLQGLQEDENFTTLVSLLESSGLAEELSAAGDITLFAPTNAAFEVLGEDQLTTLSEDTAALTEILQLHVLQGEYPVLDLNNAEEGTLSSLSGEQYVIEQSAGGLTVNDAGLESTDVDNFYSNGVVHVVSNVLVSSAAAMDDANTMTDTNGDGVVDDADMTDTNGDGVVDDQDTPVTGDTTTEGTATDTTTTDTTTTDDTTDTDGDGEPDTEDDDDGVDTDGDGNDTEQ
jgi:uncharacterized surface protein with fasciclin (FAS1) repeats